MKLHPRMMVVQKAKAEIGLKLFDMQKQLGLTDIEFLQVLTDEMQSTLKYMLRSERHPDAPDTPADQE